MLKLYINDNWLIRCVTVDLVKFFVYGDAYLAFLDGVPSVSALEQSEAPSFLHNGTSYSFSYLLRERETREVCEGTTVYSCFNATCFADVPHHASRT